MDNVLSKPGPPSARTLIGAVLLSGGCATLGAAVGAVLLGSLFFTRTTAAIVGAFLLVSIGGVCWVLLRPRVRQILSYASGAALVGGFVWDGVTRMMADDTGRVVLSFGLVLAVVVWIVVALMRQENGRESGRRSVSQ